jgi:hypothetical protein
MKNKDPLMGAKLKFKSHLQNRFFVFLSRTHLASKFSKSANMTKKNFFFKSNKTSKYAEFHTDFEYVETVVKKCTKKVISN